MKSTFKRFFSNPNNFHFFEKQFNFKRPISSFKVKNSVAFLALLTLSHFSNAQENQVQQDSTTSHRDNYRGFSEQTLDEVLVKAVRVNANSPITYSNITKKQLEKRNLGQDLPILLNHLPSVVTTSDAGAGVGYTGIRVRGTDATRVNVTINGIPYNDSESQGTFWVNLGDFASSTESLQLQRGVGTSTNGSGAFGASLNILTDAFSEVATGEISNSFGSFNTRKHTIKLSTGLLNDHFEISGRFSKIDSDGYIDRAFTDLKAYFLQGVYKDGTTLIKALAFGNNEQTYQAWAGLTADELKENRRQNPYTYKNETDNYWQDHYQLHWNECLTNQWSTTVGLNYTKGRGYFEQYKNDTEDITLYNGIVVATGTNDDNKPITDVIRRRWLDNHFYVINANATYKNNAFEIISGISYNTYSGNHFGEVIWARQFAENASINDRYYEGDADKTDVSVFSKATFKLIENITGFIDLQGRFVGYKTNGLNSDRNAFVTNAHFNFFNPKFGITYRKNEANSFYTSYARANREPNRDDFEAGITEHEQLNDVELGWRHQSDKFSLNSNIYYMFYKNQLVLTGKLDGVGNPIRATSGKSYRLGLEMDATLLISNKWRVQPNIAISDHKNIDFVKAINATNSDIANTPIAFAPNVVGGNTIIFMPQENLQLSFLSKYVGKQFLNNINNKQSMLKSYFVNDFNVVYEISPKAIFKSVVFSGLVNNIFNEKYVSNGADYGGGYIYYYPQATTNLLLGLTLKF